MKNKIRMLAVTITILLITISATTIIPTTSGQAILPVRKTAAFLSIAPSLLGVGQTMTVNLWVFPPPDSPILTLWPYGFTGVTITFTKPDGTKDTFMPIDASGGLAPGQTEQIGAIYFYYKPDQVGTWSVQFSMPQQTFTDEGLTATYLAVTSPITKFTVQKDPVNAAILNGYPPAAMATGYWTRPVNSNNREWYSLSGDWLQAGYDNSGSKYNPYSKAPNSPHILWKNQVSMGGIIGGAWGSISYGGGGGTPPIILMGRVYYNSISGGTFNCLDLRTGKLIYTAAGTLSRAHHIRASTAGAGTPQTEGAQVSAYLIETGSSSWKLYDPITGAALQTITNVPTVSAGQAIVPGQPAVPIAGRFDSKWYDGSNIIYVVRESGWNTTIKNKLAINQLIKWNLSKVTGNDWNTGIVWNVSISPPNDYGPGDAIGRATAYITSGWETGVIVMCTTAGGENRMRAFDCTTGNVVWNITTAFINEAVAQVAGDVITNWDCVEQKVYGYDMFTGKQLWVTQPIGVYPWGVQARSGGNTAYGNLYWASYDGYIYAIDITNGNIKWKSDFVGNTTETVFGTYAFYLPGPIADGKYFVATSEHTPTQPRIRGNMLICMDALTGKFLWNVSGAIAPQAISEGYLLGTSESDGIQYCFGKGQTATTVAAPQTDIAKGSGVLITGTVMDQSPAQPGTPAVSESSMTPWMNYLHMQAPLTATITGVPVILTATDSSGATTNIGTVTTNSLGNFYYRWVPTTTGVFTIQASFAGSNSYWDSKAQTAVSIVTAASASANPTAAPPTQSSTSIPSQTTTAPTATATAASASPSASPTVAPPPSSEAPSMTLYYAIAAAVIIIVVVAALVLVIKRRK